MSTAKEPCCFETTQLGTIEFGIDSGSLGELISKYGKEIVETISDAIKYGLSKDFILDILNKFGPLILNLLVGILSKKVVGAVDVDAEMVSEGVLKDIFLNRILPRLLERRGDEIADALVEALIKYLKEI